MKNKKVLITGADGFIGSHLCNSLVALGAEVTAIATYNSFGEIGWLADLKPSVLSKINVIPGDISDEIFVRNIVKNFEYVFHLAALISIPYSYIAPKAYLNTNVTGTLNILNACRDGKIKKLIHTSSSEVYGTAIYTPINEDHPLQAQSPYSASKISADHFVESYVRSFNLPAIILRPFNTYGPRQSERAIISTIIRQCLDNKFKTIKIGNLNPVRDFNYVSDTVDAFISIATAKDIKYGEVYNCGSGKGYKIGDILKKIINITNTNKKVIVDKSLIRPKSSEVYELIACSKKIKDISDWKSNVSINKGLKNTIQWWDSRFSKEKVRFDKRILY